MTIDKILSKSIVEELCVGDIKLLLEHNSYLDELAKVKVNGINRDLLCDPIYCRDRGVNYGHPSEIVQNSEFTGREIVRAESVRIYLFHKKSETTSQLSVPQLKLPIVYRQVPE
ncbi:hypothetical protein HOM13_02485 [Candidatus Woesearchaeota archaeon]|jgi:hypothetical protein|nr:hypothetical protein [Candidatus Woesearchaeota archaeon]MBT5215580.1 hypothetical protein [Candidatus Woesearchaeota archaeon]MBT6402520.1 hypothetical protein [Candidatus Woesearchaeota archaeon]